MVVLLASSVSLRRVIDEDPDDEPRHQIALHPTS